MQDLIPEEDKVSFHSSMSVSSILYRSIIKVAGFNIQANIH